MRQSVTWLDPRISASPPIRDSVHIPVSELPKRVHELPSRQETIWIADAGTEAQDAVEWLRSNGRICELQSDFEFGEAGNGRLWSPNRFLEPCVPQIPIGKALDLACGSGRDAVFLASAGFEVTAVDHLEDALVMGRDLARRYLRQGEDVEWVCSDLEQSTPSGRFDLVTCFRYLNREVLSNISRLLNPGGHLVFETFTSIHREKFGKPRTERFVLQPGELRSFVSNLTIVEYDENWHDGSHTAQLWAKNALDPRYANN